MKTIKTEEVEATPGGEAAVRNDPPGSTTPRATAPIPPSGRLLDMGEIAPAFRAATLDGNQKYTFDSVAGRPILLLFAGSGSWGPCAEALALLGRHADMFDDVRATFFGVTIDPNDVAKARIAKRLPGIRWFLDYDLAVSRLYGAARGVGERTNYVPYWMLLDSTMRVVMRAPIDQGAQIFAALNSLIALGEEQTHAPVLMVPRVFEPELCRELISLYEAHGGTDSGFMSTEGGKTVGRIDHKFKSRHDYHLADGALRATLLDRMRRRLIPQITRAFNYHPTRIERWMVGCYEAERGGFFSPHRDNTTAATAHRVFACTINLNADEFEGGELRFPEFGSRTYRAPTGGAVIFSCTLLHEAMPVTRGRRYAFLPFFYDETKALLRERNQIHLAEGGSYRASPAEQAAGSEPKDASSQP